MDPTSRALLAGAAAQGGTSTVITVNGTSYDLATSPYTATTSGKYDIDADAGLVVKIQLWGAGGTGGAGTGGAGGYAKGVYTFNGSTHTAFVGGTGTSGGSAYPDGGYAVNYGGNGGGSSRFGPSVSDANRNLSGTIYYLIAGGGGGGSYAATGGNGGGTTGQAAVGGEYSAGPGGGGTQSAGGAGGVASTYGGAGNPGAKYKGGDGTVVSSYGSGGSGGGGYYGGGAGGTVYAGGGGGSGYIDTGVMSSTELAQNSTRTVAYDPSEANRPSGRGGSAQVGAMIITLVP